MMQWSKEQLECINLTNQSIIVSASAGAGKTAVLTQRLAKRCLIDGIDMNRVLALTFTAAAASEMKDRIHKLLLDQLKENPQDSENIQKQLAFLQEAQISTIHSFCLNIIKKYGYLIGFKQDRTNNLFSGIQLKLIKQEAFNQVLANIDVNDLMTLSCYFSTRPNDYTALQNTLTHLLDEANHQVDPLNAIESIAQQYDIIDNLDQFKSLLANNYEYVLNHHLKQLSDSLSNLKINISLQYLQKNEIKINHLEQFIDRLNSIDMDTLDQIETILRYEFKGKLSVPTKNAEDATLAKEVNDKIEKLFKYASLDQTILNNNGLVDVAHSLSKALSLYYRAFNQAKEVANGIDFDDMEYLAFKILNEHKDVRKLYQDYYQEICIDEFQDTSNRQNALIDFVTTGKNIIRVGDVKQSIYRFRQANPSLMLNLMNSNEHTVIVLKENYRSSQSIIDYTNQLFSNIMNINLPNCQYLDADCVASGTQSQKENNLPVEFHALNNECIALNKESNNSNQLKANYISYLIEKSRKESKFTHYKDYCILVRSRVAMRYLKASFDAANIPYIADLNSGFSNNAFIQTIKAFFKLILDCNDASALVTILTSPYYHYSINQLYVFKQNNQSNDDSQELFKLINQLKNNLHKGISKLLSEILSFKDMYQQLCNEDRFNVDYLLQMIQTQNIQDIASLLAVLDESLDTDSSEIISVGKDDDVVQIMTIHHSKGLQFPVVILWSDSKNMDAESKELINVDQDFNIGLKAVHQPARLVSNTINYGKIATENSDLDLSERIRLLYVAITRAKEKLYIIDKINTLPTAKKVTAYDFYQRKGFSYPILSALSTNQLFQVHQINQPFIFPNNPKAHIQPSGILKYTYATKNIESDSASQQLSLETLSLETNTLALEYGTKLHEILEQMDFKDINETNLKLVDPSLTNAMIHALNQATYQLNQFETEHQIVDWYKEYPFIYQHGSTLKTGSIDLLGFNDHSFYIIDYKTTNASQEELISIYKNQLDYYASIIQSYDSAKTIHKYIYSFKHNCLIEI